MASITIASGKFAAYRTDDTSGAIPFVNILAEADGAASGFQDLNGKVWIFYITGGILYCKISTDTIGSAYGAPITIESADIVDGIPGCQQLSTGRVICTYWKTVSTVDTWFQAVSDDYGATWTKSEITTA